MTDKPSVDPNTDSIEREIPGLIPSCAVTRSMTQSKSTSDDVTTDVDLADTFLIDKVGKAKYVTNRSTKRILSSTVNGARQGAIGFCNPVWSISV